VSLLRALKREFGYYCIELVAEKSAEPEQLETVYVMGGTDVDREILSSMDRYDVVSGQWSVVAGMGTARKFFGACVIAGEIYVT
jgi:5-keto 4-deoxyuronate isomerase